jgi:adenylate cyclase
MKEHDLRTSSDRLWRLIGERVKTGADTEAIDQRIWELFGERWAVVFTDLSGFSRNVEKFGIVHFLQVIHEHHLLLLPIVEKHAGLLVKTEADSLLLLFRTVGRALDAALEMQRACANVNERRKPEEQILLCVGIGYGDLLRIGDDDIWGREVNAASKLGEDTARAGEILMTLAAKEALGDARQLVFEEIGAVAGAARNFKLLTPAR